MNSIGFGCTNSLHERKIIVILEVWTQYVHTSKNWLQLESTEAYTVVS